MFRSAGLKHKDRHTGDLSLRRRDGRPMQGPYSGRSIFLDTRLEQGPSVGLRHPYLETRAVLTGLLPEPECYGICSVSLPAMLDH